MAGVPLITGATGFAGGHLLERFISRGQAACAWGHRGSERASPSRAAAGVSWDAVDLLDRASVRDALRRASPSVIFHCAGAADVHTAWQTPARSLRINALGTHNLFESARELGLDCRVLVTGSALLYKPQATAITEDCPVGAPTPYGVSKLAQEMIAADSPLPALLVRPFNHAGPRQLPSYATSAFAQQIAEIEAGRREPVLKVGNLDARRDITDVRDTVRAYEAIAERGTPRRPYNVCSGTAHSMRALLDILLSLSRVRVRIEVDPARLRPSDNPIILGSHARLTADTGWTPEIPIERTLADLLDYWRQRGRMRSGHSETARQFVHIAMGGFALLLRWLTWWQALALAGFALVFNLLVLPRVGRGLYRPGDAARALHGIVFYPLAVLLLIVTFPRRPDIIAAAWGILAAGDGIATLAGRAIVGPRWPWNRDKTIAGSAAFAVFGAAAGVFLAWWCRPAMAAPPAMAFTLVAPVAAAIVAALVESMPVRLDDNLSVAAAAGGVMAVASLVTLAQLPNALETTMVRLPAALGLNAAVATAGYLARTVTIPGALTGGVIGFIVYSSTGWQGWTLLLVTFAAATIASRTGLKRKMVLGIAEERGGRRGPGNAIANTGVAAIAAAAALTGSASQLARLAFTAALVAGGSDTIASEIGKAFGRHTISITSLKRVAPGTSGAMSFEGTAAGIAGALGLGAVAVVLGLVPRERLALIVIAAIAGSLIESLLGATLEAPGILNNDMLNFINTATAALAAVGLAIWLS